MRSVVVVRRPTTNDRYGDEQPTTAQPRRITLTGCTVSPRFSNDLSEPGRQGALVGLSVMAPSTANVLATDQIEVDGELFDIDGDVARWASPLSRVGGVEIGLRRAVG
jgi:hypothetical protein